MGDRCGVSMATQWRRQTHHAAESRLESLNRANSRSYDDILAPRLCRSRRLSGGGEEEEEEEQLAPQECRAGSGGARKAALRRSMSADTPLTHRHIRGRIARPFQEPQQDFAGEQLEPRAFSPEKLRRAMRPVSCRRRYSLGNSHTQRVQDRFRTPALVAVSSNASQRSDPGQTSAYHRNATLPKLGRTIHCENGKVDVLLLDGTSLEATPVTVEHFGGESTDDVGDEGSDDDVGDEGSDDEYIDLTGSAASKATIANANGQAASPLSVGHGRQVAMAVDHEKFVFSPAGS